MDEEKLPPVEWIVVEKTCQHCDGTGRIGATMADLCGTCKGSGHTQRYVSLERFAALLMPYIAKEVARQVRLPQPKPEAK